MSNDVESLDARWSRRKFLGAAGAGAAAAMLLPQGVLRPNAYAEDLDFPPIAVDGTFGSEERFFSRFAKNFLIHPRRKYFTAAQKGSMPIAVLERFQKGLRRIARDPFPVYLEPSADTRAKIASGYGATVDEIAISRNTTDAISMILSGIDWRPGDEVLASTMEYPNCVATLLRVAARFGVTIRQFGVPLHAAATAEEVVDSVRRQISPGVTKVLFFSAITQPNGQVLPARRLAALAQEFSIITVVDGAHYGGMFDPQLDESGIDFWGIAGHKWQCGPGGTGILYARNGLHSANATPLPKFHLVRSGKLDAPLDGSRPAGFDLGAALSLYGFPESADWRALGEACLVWDRVGRVRIQNYILALADYAREKLMEAFGSGCLLQPAIDPELKSGIIAFNPFSEPDQRRNLALAQNLQLQMYQRHGYHMGMGGLGAHGLTRPPSPDAAAFYDGCIPNRHPVSNAPDPTDIPLRISTGFWLMRRDIDAFVDALQMETERLLRLPGGVQPLGPFDPQVTV